MEEVLEGEDAATPAVGLEQAERSGPQGLGREREQSVAAVACEPALARRPLDGRQGVDETGLSRKPEDRRRDGAERRGVLGAQLAVHVGHGGIGVDVADVAPDLTDGGAGGNEVQDGADRCVVEQASVR